MFPTILLATLLIFSKLTLSNTLTTDGVLLLAFKFSILSDPLHVLDTWSYFDDNPCSWKGVTCSPPEFESSTSSVQARVTGLSLPNVQLLGSLPANIGLLDQLQTLNLSSNSINGSLPSSLYSLPNLRVLDLSNNLISDELPELVGGLHSLEVLNLSNNALAGIIPRSLAGLGNLTDVSLQGNYLTGSLPGGFVKVRKLDVSSNLINGSLPVDFGGGEIEYLNLSYNRISGEIPAEFGKRMPENATIDFSFNNLTGEIPDVSVFSNQDKDNFQGNSDLCGPPSGSPCGIPSSPTSLPAGVSSPPIPPPAIAAIPKFDSPATIASSPDGSPKPSAGRRGGLRPYTIVAIVVGDLVGLAILAIVFLYVYRKKTTTTAVATVTTAKSIASNAGSKSAVGVRELSLSSSSSSSYESKGIGKWSCLRKGKSDPEEEEEEDEDEEETGSRDEDHQQQNQHQQGQLVTIDGGEGELEIETLLKASAFILGASGTTIMYKAALEDGTVLAVRRVGECSSVERFKDFEAQVRSIAKLVHSNLVRVRGFYWGSDEKLVIYEFVPNGNLANARYRKTGSSPCHIPWEVRLRIAKGIARGLSYIHEKKHVHGNIKPSNILLDADMEPKIADFGLERLTVGKLSLFPSGSTRHFGSKRSTASRESFHDCSFNATPCSVGASPSPTASSIGCVSPYHPPETLRTLKPSQKWDVYSFGVILLELLTGKVVVSDSELGPPVLAGLAVGLEDKTRVLRMADPAIRADLEGREETLFTCLTLGYNCISHVPQKRPSMKEALQILERIPTSSTTSYYGPLAC